MKQTKPNLQIKLSCNLHFDSGTCSTPVTDWYQTRYWLAQVITDFVYINAMGHFNIQLFINP
jgi:hypothetical protein